VFSDVLETISRLFFIFALGFYWITTLQWFAYRYERAVLHHTKPFWNAIYFALPLGVYYFVIFAALPAWFFWIFFYFGYSPSLFLWYRRLDKKLVFTNRVKRFFAILIATAIIFEFARNEIAAPLILTMIISQILENFLRLMFKRKARKKLAKTVMKNNLIVIAITASYGKTSLKHFLAAILREKYNVYFTPGNVNTDLGIAADINNNLPSGAEVYIIEAGAREKNDILTIAKMCDPQYVIIGKIGKQHIEYFKTLDAIAETKRELLLTSKLKRAIIHESAAKGDENEFVSVLKNSALNCVKSDLNGTSWELAFGDLKFALETPVLGSFNALNISLAFLMARELKVDEASAINAIKKLQNFDHRLQPIKTPNKFILDDSYNGNLDGMIAAIELCKSYNGRKAIVTPGLVESDDESNIILAQKINEVFDVVFITGALNANILCENIDRIKRKRIFDKRDLELILSRETRSGDLILFANDAPSYV
jgi:UDP-N-acetylmuramoyl-tripeptide--D-alanyl-D-alanine ligase